MAYLVFLCKRQGLEFQSLIRAIIAFTTGGIENVLAEKLSKMHNMA